MKLKLVLIAFVLAIVIVGIYGAFIRPDCYHNRVYTQSCDEKVGTTSALYFGSISFIGIIVWLVTKFKGENNEVKKR